MASLVTAKEIYSLSMRSSNFSWGQEMTDLKCSECGNGADHVPVLLIPICPCGYF
jgi:hypothetical protein